VRRLCFDTENSYFKRAVGITSNQAHRAAVLERHASIPIRLKCAVAYDEFENCYRDFRPHQLDELIDCLSSADLLISHSGLRHDLPVLECLAGERRMARLYRVRHYDLLDELQWASVEAHARRYVPKLWEQYDAEHKARRHEIIMTHKNTQTDGLSEEGHLLIELAKATFDVRCTYAIYGATSKNKF
jgi:hypothetical protein